MTPRSSMNEIKLLLLLQHFKVTLLVCKKINQLFDDCLSFGNNSSASKNDLGYQISILVNKTF